MAYNANGKIEAVDYNTTLAGATNSTLSTNLNTVWGVGSGKSGYGQTALPNVSQYAAVTAGQWATLINTINRVATHQSTAVTAYTAPAVGAPIVQLSALQTNISNLFSGRNNAAGQGTTTAVTTTNATTWFNYLTFTHTVTFASGDAARYFFNAGGQLALTFSHPTGTGINSLFNALATAAGTVVISSPNASTVTIATVPYEGVKKIGGSGTETSFPMTGTTGWARQINSGYWGLTTTATEIFRQYGSGVTGYNSSFLSVSARTSSATGPNSDNGATITITTTFDEIPNGLINSSGTAVTLTVRPPSTSSIPLNTWGTVNAGSGTSIGVVGSVTGQ